ncbi:Mg/Co/Ni transporter MgtE (contains CBS domain) [Alteracholeplasma palmae J233]|uniref:Magnesium transporter MgtE n=1 Tax=Alteracholeplasma palmae (strain ATCC 49389 / J233) TaxID=1318466 RepID=U4KPN5_ALTPJ|nr:magnesium transporter [Alteracholeplasma palmae]CCV64235.1 Mg/Co/Ni transporter MgtE (contains CBS domain) [Alteracholeplasma palmae J233]
MINKYINEKQFKKAYIEFIKLHPHDQAQALVQLDFIDQVRLLHYLKDSELSELLTYLDSEDSAKLITELDILRQKNVLDQMDIDDAVDIIDELEDKEQEAILNLLEEKEEYQKLLNYDEDEAGSLMTFEYVEIESQTDVKQALKILIEKAPLVESITTMFITRNKQYLGTVKLNELIKAKSPLLIDTLLTETPYIKDKDDIDKTIHIMREYGLYEIAVCNDEENLIGIITLDDAIGAYEIEAKEDFAKLSAITDTEDKNILKASLHRLPWLVILLLATIPIALASSMFEEVILSVTILSLFQPLILDASGDVATQTLAVTLRKLNQEDKSTFKDGSKEILTGLINGIILGMTSAVITYFLAHIFKMDQPFMVSLVVGLALLLSVVIGPVLGFMIPVTLNKFKLDPAVASGPFITTLVDILSLVIFFGLATILLGVA